MPACADVAWCYDVRPVSFGVPLFGLSQQMVSLAFKVAARIVLETIVNGWPIDTGKSIAGFRVDKMGDGSWRVLNRVEYTPHVHDGLADILAAEGIEKARAAFRREIEKLAEVRPSRPGPKAPKKKRVTPKFARPPAIKAPKLASGFRLPAASVKEARTVVAPLIRAGRVPSQVGVLIARGQLVQAAGTLRSLGLRREAQRLERIDRRGRRV